MAILGMGLPGLLHDYMMVCAYGGTVLIKVILLVAITFTNLGPKLQAFFTREACNLTLLPCNLSL